MAKKTVWTVTLADGTAITGLKVNGSNFVSEKEITPDVFAGKLSKVTITGPDDEFAEVVRGVHGPMRLAEGRVQKWPDGYYFVLVDIPEEELKELKAEEDTTNIQLALAEVYELIGG